MVNRKIWIVVYFIFLFSSCTSIDKPQSSNLKRDLRSPAGFYGEARPPIVSVPGNHFYSDSQNSKVDASLYAQNEKARKPLRDYLDQVIHMTEKAAQGDPDASIAVYQWLLKWALGDALTKVESQQGGFERKWLLSGLRVSYLANEPHDGWEQRDQIVQWLDRLTRLMMEDYQSYQKSSQRNNHVYWAGLVAIEMSLVNNDQNLFKWGFEKIRFGLSQVDPNGFLPLELDRREKALQYHRVSLEALMMAAYLLKEKGYDLLAESNGALERLAQTTFRGFKNPSIFATKTGATQDFQLKDSTAWIAIYIRLKPDNLEMVKFLKANPANWNRALGGRPIDLLERSRLYSLLDLGNNGESKKSFSRSHFQQLNMKDQVRVRFDQSLASLAIS